MKKGRIKLVEIHGFNVKDRGVGTIGKFTLFVAMLLRKMGYEVVIDADTADYNRHLLLRANYFYWFGDTIERIAGALEDDPEFDMVVTICHSNGANYCMKALKKIKNPNLGIIFISAALNRKYKFKQEFAWLANFMTFKDKIVGISKRVPFSSWGDGGQVGFTNTNDRIGNYDHTNPVNRHSDWSEDHSIEIPGKAAANLIHIKFQQQLEATP